MITRWWLVAIAAAAIVSFGAGWSINGWRRDAAEKAAVEAAIVKTMEQLEGRDTSFVELQARDQATTAANAKLRQQNVDQALTLQEATRGLQLVETRVTAHDQNSCDCADSRRGSTFRLCYNAAVSGDAAAVAACEAERGPRAVRRE